MPRDNPSRGLRHVRQERSSFDARFFERHPHFWPIARAASCFADRADWPEVTEYAGAFEVAAPVRFELGTVRRRRPAGPIVRDALYDAMIVGRRIVPTRPRMWHDYLNALVWATFPQAKLALHGRQHAAIEKWIPEGATQLPNARTRELDALALVDEGGALVLDDGETGRTTILFGHALYEGLVFGQPAMVARAVLLDERRVPRGSARERTAQADLLLAEILSDTTKIVSPDELPRLPLQAIELESDAGAESGIQAELRSGM